MTNFKNGRGDTKPKGIPGPKITGIQGRMGPRTHGPHTQGIERSGTLRIREPRNHVSGNLFSRRANESEILGFGLVCVTAWELNPHPNLSSEMPTLQLEPHGHGEREGHCPKALGHGPAGLVQDGVLFGRRGRREIQVDRSQDVFAQVAQRLF